MATDRKAYNPRPPQLVTERVAAPRVGVKVSTLQAWRSRKIGPPWLKIQGAVRYDLASLDAWLATRQRGTLDGESA